MKRAVIYTIALWVAAIGCINIGLAGFFGLDLIAVFFWNHPFAAMLTYGLIALCGIYVIIEWCIRRKTAMSKKVDWPYNKPAKFSKKGKAKRKASETDMTR